MRRLYRAMAKVQMAKKGYPHVNRQLKNNRWRRFLGLKPIAAVDNPRFCLEVGKVIPDNFKGRGSRKRKKGATPCLLVYG